MDGARRVRLEDAIIDYSIGLESLLTAGIRDELKYRFALRGSIVLNWEGGNRKESLKLLQDLYDTRSMIVHGEFVDSRRLKRASDVVFFKANLYCLNMNAW
ncbi:MAG: hypothetical protein JSU58_08540 [Dehalococcoidales bacterium]|nr:MAG: hypothetical protein JSU58_08540 [Dehalococcoidales bacterium]